MDLTKKAMNTSFGSLYNQVINLSKVVESMRAQIHDLEETIDKIKRDNNRPSRAEMEMAPSRLSEDDYSSDEDSPDEIQMVPPPAIRHISTVPAIKTRRRTSYVMVPKVAINLSDYSDSDSDGEQPPHRELEEL